MISELIDDLLCRRAADADRVESALTAVLEGRVTPAQLGGLLVALRTAPLSPELLAAAARAVRASAVALPTPSLTRPLVDTCGTGGDGARTLNVSSAAALAVAACGGAVAKHGNRGVSSPSGSADLYEALGVPVDLEPTEATRHLEVLGFAFLFAPRYHPALARVAPVRRELGVRTLFNLLGPLLSPAGAPSQLLGVYDPDLTETVALALRELGTARALVVHSSGLDELGLHAPTRGHLLFDGRVQPFAFDPGELGLARVPLDVLRVDSVTESALAVRCVLAGQPGPALEVCALNAGAALFVAGIAADLREGHALAKEAFETGRAASILDGAQRLAAGGAS